MAVIEKYGMWAQVIPVTPVSESSAAGWSTMSVNGNPVFTWGNLSYELQDSPTYRGRLSGKYPGVGVTEKTAGTTLGVNKVPANSCPCVLVEVFGLFKFVGVDWAQGQYSKDGVWRKREDGFFPYIQVEDAPFPGVYPATMTGWVRRLCALVAADDHVCVSFGRGSHYDQQSWESLIPLQGNPAKSFEVYTQEDVEQADFWTQLKWTPVNVMHRGFHLRCGDFSCFRSGKYDPTIAAPEDPPNAPGHTNDDLHTAHWGATTSPWRSELDSPQFHGNVVFATDGGVVAGPLPVAGQLPPQEDPNHEFAYSVFRKATKDTIELIARETCTVWGIDEGQPRVLSTPFSSAPNTETPAYLPFRMTMVLWKPLTETASPDDFALLLAATDSVFDQDTVPEETPVEESVYGPLAMKNFYEALGNPNKVGIGTIGQGAPAAIPCPTYMELDEEGAYENSPYPYTPWYTGNV